jgi:hypothetical protein
MKLRNNKFLLTILYILYFNLVFSQSTNEKEQVQRTNDSSYVSVSLNYINDAVFMGRKDSITAPYIYTSITYHHKSGCYATGSLSYLTRSNEGRVDLFLLSAGFDFTAEKLSGDLSVTKYIFNEDSYNVISEVEADVTLQLIYDFNIINLGISSGLYFNSGSTIDFFLSSELSHDFLSKSYKFQISPTAGVFFGSQQFYEQYYINNRFGNGRGQQGQGSNNQIESSTINLTESETFGLMAVEFSLPMWYVHKSWVFSFLPIYVLPQNPSTLTVDNLVFTEDLDNTFYCITGIAYRF